MEDAEDDDEDDVEPLPASLPPLDFDTLDFDPLDDASLDDELALARWSFLPSLP